MIRFICSTKQPVLIINNNDIDDNDDRPDTKYIYVNVGFGFHVQFTLDEAKNFIDKKEQQLQRY